MSFTLSTPVSAKLRVVGSQRSTSSTASSRAALIRPCKSAHAARVAFTTRCVAQSRDEDPQSRRDVMLCSAGLIALSSFPALPAMADDEPLATFYGAANPPATPGKVGGVEKSLARYTFQYPESWKEENISKVEKGTNGTDVRFNGPARKKEKLFVLTLLNYGGKNGFTMEQNPTTLLKSLTGSLFFFQDALEDGELTARSITKNGQKFFEYSLVGPDSYLIQVTVTDGRVFGFFVNASQKFFDSDATLLRTMVDSFDTFPNA